MKTFLQYTTESVADQLLHTAPPAQIVLTRVNYRSFNNDLSIALFYARSIDRYFTVPFVMRSK